MKENVMYKTVGPDCKVEVRAAALDQGEPRIIGIPKGTVKRTLGLIFETNVALPVGTVVDIDLRFPGYDFSYRPRGIVAWASSEDSQINGDSATDAPLEKMWKMGVIISKMDKFDKDGLRVPVEPPVKPAPPPPEAQPAQAYFQDVASTKTGAAFEPISKEQLAQIAEFSMMAGPPLAEDDTEYYPAVDEGLMETRLAQPEMDLPAVSGPLPNPDESEPVSVEPQLPGHVPDSVGSDPVAPTDESVEPPEAFERRRHREKGALKEIFDILTACLLNRPGVCQQWLDGVSFLDKEPPAKTVSELLENPAVRADFSFEIPAKGGHTTRPARMSFAASAQVATDPANLTEALPGVEETAQLFSEFAGVDVGVSTGQFGAMTLEETAVLAEFITLPNELVTVCAIDPALAAWMGSSFSTGQSDGPAEAAVNVDGDEQVLAPVQEQLVADEVPELDRILVDPAATPSKAAQLDYVWQETASKIPFPDAHLYTAGDTWENQDFIVEEKMLEAFDRLHEVFEIRERDQAANFGMRLAMDLIECQAAICVLMTPEQDELYIAAVAGPLGMSLVDERRPLDRGVWDYAIQTGETQNVVEPASDERYEAEFDEKLGFYTRNLICAPIFYKAVFIGGIQLLNSARLEGFIEGEANVLGYICMSLGEVIGNSFKLRQIPSVPE